MNTLKRQLGFWDSVAINVGIVIGVGIFRTPGSVAQYLDSTPLILLAWIAGGLVAMLGVFCYAELAVCRPHTGGTYIFLRDAYGKPLGFLFGWAEFAILRAGSVAGVAYILTDYLQHFIPFPDQAQKLVVILLIALFTFINVIGIHIGTGVQNVLSFLKIAAIAGMVLAIFAKVGIPFHRLQQEAVVMNQHWKGFAPALIPILWTYGGWHQSTFMSGEFHDTKRALPLSLIMGAVVVTAAYLLMNAAYLTVFTPAEMYGTKTIASDIFASLFGDGAKILISGAILISASGALNSTILTGGRIPFAVAQDYPKMSWAAKVDSKFHTPLRSLVLNGIWASVLVLWGNFDQLLFFFAFANWLFFALVGGSVFVLRMSSPNAVIGDPLAGFPPKACGNDAFQLPGYPWVPVLFTLSSVALCVITLIAAPRESLFGMLLLLAGIPIYFLFKPKSDPVSA